MIKRDIYLSAILSIVLILLGNYYIWTTSKHISIFYLFLAIIVLLLSIKISHYLGFYSEHPQFAATTPIPILIMIVVATLENGESAVASIAIGSGLAGLFALLALYLK
ncbi:hypothetical protein [Halorussus amylolyticus]|uniref:hypothetical protein n=1 Tax=Halorussus amylolyticus TaxID=1126242 RepID=UPI00138F410F|nr:hypothetical protein [Halorussus amylolyticus]